MIESLKSFLHPDLQLIILFSVFLGAAVISFFAQYTRYRKDLSLPAFFFHCFPQATWKSGSTRIDLIVYAVTKLSRGLTVMGDLFLLVLVANGVRAGLGALLPAYHPVEASLTALVVSTLVLFLVTDFSSFFMHYMQHKVPFLWELHKAHHSATVLTPLTDARKHPIADKIDLIQNSLMVGIPIGVAQFVFGLSLADILMMNANAHLIGTILVLDNLKHSQFAVSFGGFDRILMSPHMHHLHHSTRLEHWDKNMGTRLSVWDWMFGTAIIPEKGVPLVYGIGRGAELDESYQTVHGFYVRPVIDMWRVFCQQVSGRYVDLPLPEADLMPPARVETPRAVRRIRRPVRAPESGMSLERK